MRHLARRRVPHHVSMSTWIDRRSLWAGPALLCLMAAASYSVVSGWRGVGAWLLLVPMVLFCVAVHRNIVRAQREWRAMKAQRPQQATEGGSVYLSVLRSMSSDRRLLLAGQRAVYGRDQP